MERKVGYEIKQLNTLIERNIIEYHKDINKFLITPVQLQIILYLLNNKEAYQKELEDYLKIRRSTISGILKTMEKNNMIKKVKSIEDARVNKIVLTNLSKERIKFIKNQATIYENKITSNITEEELKIFFKVIDIIKNNINKGDAK